MMKIVLDDRGIPLADQVELANRFWTRFRGWIGKSSVYRNQALVLYPCNSVHTIGMRFPIDVLFLDSEYRVIRMIEHMAPFRISPVVRGSKWVIELCSGEIQRHSVNIGQTIKML